MREGRRDNYVGGKGVGVAAASGRAYGVGVAGTRRRAQRRWLYAFKKNGPGSTQ